ncbi:CDR ABC transporter [Penicillium samsonianum]|uniref:CDR ABC transporter n=1 Tax=Penicillium samsonianum TaxID=1882272 RepID=UPI002547B9BC|nr:CDR ABC transporter [Penicillium samsonianum]KAJ6149157.1 CDR ABC transporter [Penicillium samsonianum]
MDYFTRNAQSDIDWHTTWRESPEYQNIGEGLDKLRKLANKPPTVVNAHDSSSYQEFSAPIATQFMVVGCRVFQQYWRSPGYIYSKAQPCIFSVGIVYWIFLLHGGKYLPMAANRMVGIFIVLIVLMQLIFQTLPAFVTQRTVFEAR